MGFKCMPIFKYTVIDPEGNKIKSTINAPDEGAAGRLLQGDDFIIQELIELKGAAAGKKGLSIGRVWK